jgi:hypothetical protein
MMGSSGSSFVERPIAVLMARRASSEPSAMISAVISAQSACSREKAKRPLLKRKGFFSSS